MKPGPNKPRRTRGSDTYWSRRVVYLPGTCIGCKTHTYTDMQNVCVTCICRYRAIKQQETANDPHC